MGAQPQNMSGRSVPDGRAPEATPADVAAWLRARTQNTEGDEIGLWNESTRPTVDQVEVAITQARTLVAGRMGWDPPDACSWLYETVVSLQAACIIEKSYFPEQVVSGRSPYEQLSEELVAGMDSLNTCIVNGGLGPGEGGGEHGAYSICTPAEHCGGDALWAPGNWNDPYAHDIDDPYETNDAAVQWLRAHQFMWQGQPIVYNPLSRQWEIAVPNPTPVDDGA